MDKKDIFFYTYSWGTQFKASGDYDPENEIDNFVPCFGDLVKYGPRQVIHEVIKVRLYKPFAKATADMGNNNICFYSKDEIARHLDRIQCIKKFNYNIEEEEERFIVHINVTAHMLYIKFILTWLRIMYEFPYNVLYKEALCLNRFSEFNDWNILSIYNFVCSCNYTNFEAGYEDGLIYSARFTEPLTYKQLAKKLEDCIARDDFYINPLFDIVDIEGPTIPIDPKYDYSYYRDDVVEAVHGECDLEDCEEDIKPFYNIIQKHRPFITELPTDDDQVFKRIDLSQETIDGKWINRYYNAYWMSARHFKARLEVYLENLEIMNNYLKSKK